jgi:sporulation protein YlmC with PRC-barrel domain
MKFLTATAFAVLMTTSALAQQTPAQPSTMPSANQPATPGQQGAEANRFETRLGQDQWLVGNHWGKKVYNASGQSIGDLNDVVIDKEGKISALVVGVGGFLGLGEKNVAVNWDQLKQTGSISPSRIVLGMTEQDLRNAPAFVRNESGGSMSDSNR